MTELLEEKQEESLKPLKFEILAPTNEVYANEIKFNFEELKTGIAQRIEKYKNLTYTEEQFKEAKKDRATLNNLKKDIETERIRIKNMVLNPYEKDFKPQVDEIIALLNEPISSIDTQVKNFEEKQKQVKFAELEKIFNENNNITKIKINFDKISKPEWGNLTNSIKKIKTEILETIEKIKSDLNIISDFQSIHEVALLDKYQETLKLDEVMRLKKSLEVISSEISSEQTKQPETLTQEKKYYIKAFEVKATKEDLIAIQNLLNERNIVFRILT